MSVLINPQHELFARLVFKGVHPSAAYEQVGFKPHRGNAHRLRTSEDVKARIEELNQEAAKVACLDKAYVIHGLMLIFEKSSQEYPVLDKEGKPTGEYRYDSNGAIRALELLGKTADLKLFSENVNLRKIVDPDDLTDEEAIAIALKLKERGE